MQLKLFLFERKKDKRFSLLHSLVCGWVIAFGLLGCHQPLPPIPHTQDSSPLKEGPLASVTTQDLSFPRLNKVPDRPSQWSDQELKELEILKQSMEHTMQHGHQETLIPSS